MQRTSCNNESRCGERLYINAARAHRRRYLARLRNSLGRDCVIVHRPSLYYMHVYNKYNYYTCVHQKDFQVFVILSLLFSLSRSVRDSSFSGLMLSACRITHRNTFINGMVIIATNKRYVQK